MNVILSDNGSSFVYSLFNEDEAYFTMHIKKENDLIVVCSEPFSGETGWEEIQNNSLTELKCL
jgi:predicted glutamine amidotransferase